MRFLTTIILLILMTGCLYAQVSNVRVQQRTDGNFMVDIYYDFINPDGYEAEIAVVASGDNGATWELACSSSNQTGDLGEGISAGSDKHIEWDFYADNPNTSGSQFKVRVLCYYYDTMTGNDGTVYKTVKIGDQWWMAENLRETQYRNLDGIPEITNTSVWGGLETGARCVYDNEESNGDIYGYLYNWYAVNHPSNIAPSGWHVATDGDWSELATYLDMGSPSYEYNTYSEWEDQGAKLAGRVDLWEGNSMLSNPNFNVSRFTAVAGGYRNSVGSFVDNDIIARIWTASSYNLAEVWIRVVNCWGDFTRSSMFKEYGQSVRLVKD